MIGMKELVIVLVVVVLVFGTRKLATLGKDLGAAVGGFGKGIAEAGAGTPDARTSDRDSP